MTNSKGTNTFPVQDLFSELKMSLEMKKKAQASTTWSAKETAQIKRHCAITKITGRILIAHERQSEYVLTWLLTTIKATNKLAAQWKELTAEKTTTSLEGNVSDDSGRETSTSSQLQSSKTDEERQPTPFFQVPPDSESSTEELDLEREPRDSEGENSSDEEPIFWPEKPQVLQEKMRRILGL